jgi:molybdate transport system substrate-binding protein
MRTPVLVLLVLCGLSSALRAEQQLLVAAASDLVYCLDELHAAFRRENPDIELKTSTGSSGNFFAQIKNGAPFDIFLSADLSYPRELIKAGLADEKSLTPYAAGRIVLWTTNDKIDLTPGLAALTATAIRKIAIANPDHAPYGRAAKASLEYFKIWDQMETKVVYGENIAQTAQFVETGNADAGIVALALVLSPKLANVGHWVEIPPESYPRLDQAAVVTKKGCDNPASALYLTFLRSPSARKIFDRFGFRLP